MELQSHPLPCLLQSPILGRGMNYNIPYDMEQNHIVGFRFRPTTHELVYKYLKEKLNGVLIDCEDIPEINVYDYEPSDLRDFFKNRSKDDEFYFFCAPKYIGKKVQIRKRKTPYGYWKITGDPHPVKHKTTKTEIGIKRILEYRYGKGKGVKTEWVMHEYTYTEKCSNGGNSSKSNQGDFVLCVIKKKFDKKCGKSKSNFSKQASLVDQNDACHVITPSRSDKSESSLNLSSSFVSNETNSRIYRNEDSYVMPSDLGNHMPDRGSSFLNDSTYFHPLDFEDILNYDFQEIAQGDFSRFLLSPTNCECLETSMSGSTSGDMNQNQPMFPDILTIDSESDVLEELDAFF